MSTTILTYYPAYSDFGHKIYRPAIKSLNFIDFVKSVFNNVKFENLQHQSYHSLSHSNCFKYPFHKMGRLKKLFNYDLDWSIHI